MVNRQALEIENQMKIEENTEKAKQKAKEMAEIKAASMRIEKER